MGPQDTGCVGGTFVLKNRAGGGGERGSAEWGMSVTRRSAEAHTQSSGVGTGLC